MKKKLNPLTQICKVNADEKVLLGSPDTAIGVEDKPIKNERKKSFIKGEKAKEGVMGLHIPTWNYKTGKWLPVDYNPLVLNK